MHVTHKRTMMLLSTLILAVFTMAATAEIEPVQVTIESKFVEIQTRDLDELRKSGSALAEIGVSP